MGKGFSCDKECPKDGDGTICGGHGTCDLKWEKAQCVCTYGWRGDDCSITCPGLRETGQACNGNGHCEVDTEKREASCKCKKTHMGEACTHRCPMDPHSDLACGGELRGMCVKDSEAVPSGTRCECKEPYAGKTCHVTCPMFQGKICGGNGECFIKSTGGISVGICKCDVGFTGPNCQGACPTGEKVEQDGANEDTVKGDVCSGHGVCGFTSAQRAECTCDDGWVTGNCAQRVCRTEKGLFNKETEECTCPAGEVCCERETIRLAEMMKKMLDKEAQHRTSKVETE